jgi:peptidoglycan/xylan/chitin deacetylase (PgdA/CDA1 family)
MRNSRFISHFSFSGALLVSSFVLVGTACKPRKFNEAKQNEFEKVSIANTSTTDLSNNTYLLGLKEYELSLTIDDGPSVQAKDFYSELRCKHDIMSTLFVVGKTLQDRGTQGTETLAISQKIGHLIANHAYLHPIRSVDANGNLKTQGFSDFTGNEMLRLIKENHDLIRTYTHGNIFLFRSPGDNWDASFYEKKVGDGRASAPPNPADVLNKAGLSNYYVGPISWDIPKGKFKVDWQCWSQGLTPAECAKNYYDAIVSEGNRGIIIVHDLVLPTGTAKMNDGNKNSAPFHYTREMLMNADKTKGLFAMLANSGKPWVWKRMDQIPGIADRLSKLRDGNNLPVATLGKGTPRRQDIKSFCN